MVSDPLVEYFAKQPGGHVHVTVATRSQENGQRLARIGPNVQLVIADVQTGLKEQFCCKFHLYFLILFQISM
jgi:hypothetical protein